MTPEAIRTVSQLRQEFYSLFAAAMKVQVIVTPKNSSTNNLPIAFWIDNRGKLNYMRICVYTAPDALIPERPFILRLSVNKGAGIVIPIEQGRNCRRLNQDWHFELTLLPEEILDFLPWIVSLIKYQEKNSASFVPEPPHPFQSKTFSALLVNGAWTQKAWQKS